MHDSNIIIFLLRALIDLCSNIDMIIRDHGNWFRYSDITYHHLSLTHIIVVFDVVGYTCA